MKTPEQIAAEIDMPLSFFRLPVGEQLEAFAAAAIEADRAHHDLSYAHQIIDRHNARAVIWGRGDVQSVLDDMIEDEVIEEPTTADYNKIIDRAMDTHCWRSLGDCTEGDWDAIREAIREAL